MIDRIVFWRFCIIAISAAIITAIGTVIVTTMFSIIITYTPAVTIHIATVNSHLCMVLRDSKVLTLCSYFSQ